MRNEKSTSNKMKLPFIERREKKELNYILDFFESKSTQLQSHLCFFAAISLLIRALFGFAFFKWFVERLCVCSLFNFYGMQFNRLISNRLPTNQQFCIWSHKQTNIAHISFECAPTKPKTNRIRLLFFIFLRSTELHSYTENNVGRHKRLLYATQLNSREEKKTSIEMVRI